MKRVSYACEYLDEFKKLSLSDLAEMASAIADTAVRLMRDRNLYRIVILCDSMMREIGELTCRFCRNQYGFDSSVYSLDRDDIPGLDNCLVCDCLFSLSKEDATAGKRVMWLSSIIESQSPVLSVGIPAGVNPDTGESEATALRSAITIAFNEYLVGLFFRDGLDYCGEIEYFGNKSCLSENGLVRFEDEDAKSLLRPRKRTAHKGDSGKAVLCVGSNKYAGAALVSSKAALAAGCGILYVACPDAVKHMFVNLPEAIIVKVGNDWGDESCMTAIKAFSDMNAIGIGCGVGDGDLSQLLEAAFHTKLPLVLDADGLNCLSKHHDLYCMLHENVILTPHPGEMSRLLGISTETVLADPISISKQFAARWKCIVLLKGAATIVTNGRLSCIVAEGNSGLGKGGSGDALTGIITGLLAQGVEPFNAACLGSYLLGTSANRAFTVLGERMLRASNVIEALKDINI